MKVRLKIAWQVYPKGHVFTTMPAAQAEVMVCRGLAEYVGEPVTSPVNRMMRAGRARLALRKEVLGARILDATPDGALKEFPMILFAAALAA